MAVQPPTMLRQKGSEAVPTSLDVLEDFFGEKITHQTARLIRKLPVKQANELVSRLYDHLNATLAAFTKREIEITPAASRYAAQFRSKRYDKLETGEINVNEEAIIRSVESPDIATCVPLKYLSLLCERTVIWDPLMVRNAGENSWREPLEWIRELAYGARQLAPIADLVRSGHIVLARTTPLEASQGFDGTFIQSEVGFEDPYNCHLLAQECERSDDFRNRILTSLEYQRMFHDINDLERHAPYIADIMVQRYPLPVTRDALRKAVAFSAEVRKYRLTPVTTDPVVKHHLTQGDRVLLGEDPDAVPAESSASRFLRYRIPDLTDLSLSDIARLRNDQEVFAEIRWALSTVTREAEKAGECEDLSDYRKFLYECGADVLNPAFDGLRRMERRAKTKSFLSKAARKGLTLGLDAFLTPAAGALGDAFEYVARGQPNPRLQNVKVAHGILKSLC